MSRVSDKYDISNIVPLKAYLDRIGAEVLNHKRYMVKEHKGNYYIERCLIKLMDDGEIDCKNEEYAPTDAERAAIIVAVSHVEFPKNIQASSIIDLKPKLIGEPFVFIDRRTNGIIMVQERRINKVFMPWTFFSDGEWRAMEPDGKLPFWKPDQQTSSKIMVHEGPKAARYVQQMINDPAIEHPWKEFLSGYCHWGMIGGALAPHRVDYDEIHREKPTEVVYVCDNDYPGKSVLAKMSNSYGRALKGVIFGNSFPVGFDIADPMPKEFFNGKRYNGPSLMTYVVPATRATEAVPNPAGKGRPVMIMRPDFAQEWFHSITPEVYVHKDWPNKIYGPEEFNNAVRPYSDVSDTARLLQKDAASKTGILKYIPHLPSGIDASVEGHYINTHVPSAIKAERGDATPWEKYINYLVPDDGDRIELMRWCATLVNRPANRMLYGVLMISEVQGIGKSTLGEKILAPLVGEDNFSSPSEHEIVEGNFNTWMAHKRLAVVHEIYSGHSWKAYNRLKSVVADDKIEVNKKFQNTYKIENWMHVYACSNSLRALRLDNDDRRWFVPQLTKAKRTYEAWDELHEWIKYEGGLGIIKWWLEQFLKTHPPVLKGEIAPNSAMKREIVEEGYSDGQKLVSQTFDILNSRIKSGALPEDIILLDIDLVEFIRDMIYDGRHNDRTEKPATLRKIAQAKGWHVLEVRAKVYGWGSRTFGSRVIAAKSQFADLSPGQLSDMGLKPSSAVLRDLRNELIQL